MIGEELAKMQISFFLIIVMRQAAFIVSSYCFSWTGLLEDGTGSFSMAYAVC